MKGGVNILGKWGVSMVVAFPEEPASSALTRASSGAFSVGGIGKLISGGQEVLQALRGGASWGLQRAGNRRMLLRLGDLN